MTQPTPWQLRESPRAAQVAAPGVTPWAQMQRALRSGWTASLRGNAGYLVAAVANLVTLVMLFRPWITVTGPDGMARADAFGRIEATTSYLMAWSGSGPSTADISGTWAIFTTATIIVLVTVVVINLRIGKAALYRIAVASGIAVAIFVLLTMRNLNSRASDLMAMTARSWDAGGQVGSWIQWAFSGGDLMLPGVRSSGYSTTSFTGAALIACGASMVAAVAAITQWMIQRSKR
ncbi:hypothetical protein AB0L63_24440 [Nocardia sp. NPDC051990]|uniref:hypothetical protein n=1 Tax=Nocardia sp. NPDC051990 TaxID=3155285 RepID=UPI00341511DE